MILLFSNVRLAGRAGLEMRKPRSCSFEASKCDTLILKQLLYEAQGDGNISWSRTSAFTRKWPLRGHTGLGTAALSDWGDWPPYLREEMTKRKHATEQNKEGNKGGKLGLRILINTKIMARGIQWMGVIRLPCYKGDTCSLSDWWNLSQDILRSLAWFKKYHLFLLKERSELL